MSKTKAIVDRLNVLKSYTNTYHMRNMIAKFSCNYLLPKAVSKLKPYTFKTMMTFNLTNI